MRKKSFFSGKTLFPCLCLCLFLTGCQGAADSGEEQVATKDEMAAEMTLDTENLTPVSGDQIADGTYSISVESSSPMFNVESCELTAQGGELTARMTMGGTGYLYVYMGTGQEAAQAGDEDYIPFEENADGTHSFTVPVEALNTSLPCAAFSKKKEKWYDRSLVFSADSLPLSALDESLYSTPQSLRLEDGTYQVEASLEGGSGRASVASPATLTVSGGQAQVELVWGSGNYTFVRVEGAVYETQLVDGHSVCTIPVPCFDWGIPISANTVAMSEPHEVAYTLRLSSDSISPMA